jgi:diketogulonate reductase-like aldo/keto reductase
MRTVTARDGMQLPVVGQGTWGMGNDPANRAQEVAALGLGLELGMTHIDTAEMYASGRAEEIVGEVIRGRRDQVFVTSKVLPENASRDGTLRAAERSLQRLATDRLDLYLLHWPGKHPIADTLEAFTRLVEQGKILRYGVSNFDVADLTEAATHPAGAGLFTNQVLYNLVRRGGERTVFPWCASRGALITAYSPIEQGRLKGTPALAEVARRHGVSPEGIAVAWTVRHDGVVAIPKATQPSHVRANADAAKLSLTSEDLAALDRDYPPPSRDLPLETL